MPPSLALDQCIVIVPATLLLRRIDLNRVLVTACELVEVQVIALEANIPPILQSRLDHHEEGEDVSTLNQYLNQYADSFRNTEPRTLIEHISKIVQMYP